MIVADIARRCEQKACGAMKTAERALRDVLVIRCRSQTVLKDRKSFLETAEEAFGRPLDRELRAVILLAYHKITKGNTDTFPSNSQLNTVRRGYTRPRRERGTVSDAAVNPALQDTGDSAAATKRRSKHNKLLQYCPSTITEEK